jgi:hypothetical protein
VKANLPPFAQLLFDVWSVAAVSCTCHCQFEYGPCHLLKETTADDFCSSTHLPQMQELGVLTRTGTWWLLLAVAAGSQQARPGCEGLEIF